MRRLLAALLLVATTACTADWQATDRREVVVLAAASLTGAIEELARQFEAAHPDTDVVLSTGASSTLAQQAVAGTPADLLVLASLATMGVVTNAGEADGEPVVVARNRLQIAVPAGNPGRVTGLPDLARPDLDVALCAPQVPCGAAAQQALEAAGVTAAPDTLERDVKAVLAKVRLGEVDAGLVYVTDVRAAGADVEGIGFPEAAAARNDYPAVVLRGGEQSHAAREFLDLLLSPDGQAVLARAGFAPPP